MAVLGFAAWWPLPLLPSWAPWPRLPVIFLTSSLPPPLFFKKSRKRYLTASSQASTFPQQSLSSTARLGGPRGPSSTLSPLPLRTNGHNRFHALLLLPPISLVYGRPEPPLGLLPLLHGLSSCYPMMTSAWPPGSAFASPLLPSPLTLSVVFVAVSSCRITSWSACLFGALCNL